MPSDFTDATKSGHFPPIAGVCLACTTAKVDPGTGFFIKSNHITDYHRLTPSNVNGSITVFSITEISIKNT